MVSLQSAQPKLEREVRVLGEGQAAISIGSWHGDVEVRE